MAEAFFGGDLRFATSDFYDSTGEFSKYRKALTYKICDAVHTRPPWIARPVYVKCEQISSDLRPGEVWCGQGITHASYIKYCDSKLPGIVNKIWTKAVGASSSDYASCTFYNDRGH